MGASRSRTGKYGKARDVMTFLPTDDHASAELRIQELTKELSQARGELTAAREQQAATAEILTAISSSRTSPDRVFTAIAARAAQLCGGYDASIFELVGDHFRLVARYGAIATNPVGHDFPLSRGYVLGRAVIDARPVHVADLQAETNEYPEGSAIANEFGHRTTLAVPLLQSTQAIGAIALRRLEVNPFTQGQVGLLQTFADQAVIAIENTRLFEAEQASKRELQESLEYQTATSDVLSVISHSKFELQPVLDAIAKIANRLCAADATIQL